MRVIITRPATEARQWADFLRDAGHEPVVLPLIDIEPLADVSQIRRAWHDLDGFISVMFVSANAVHFFMLARPLPAGGAPAQPICTRAWATGPGTRQALLAHGWPPHLIDTPPDTATQFDSEALWAVVKPQVGLGHQVLVVRGESVGMPLQAGATVACHGAAPENGPTPKLTPGLGRDWLALRIAESGATPFFCISYVRCMPLLAGLQTDLLQGAAGAGAVWLFSSSEALKNLVALVPDAKWEQARAVATHARIAQQARLAGFGTVQVTRPTLADVLASIESLA